MKHIKIEPEVISGMGEKTIINTESHPPIVSKLHISLEDWLGDDLMECFPCFLITEKFRYKLSKSNFTGFHIEKIKVTKAEYFYNNYSLKQSLPIFHWLQITGNHQSDFYINDKYLMISEEVYTLLKSDFNINFAQINQKKEDSFFAEFMKNRDVSPEK